MPSVCHKQSSTEVDATTQDISEQVRVDLPPEIHAIKRACQEATLRGLNVEQQRLLGPKLKQFVEEAHICFVYAAIEKFAKGAAPQDKVRIMEVLTQFLGEDEKRKCRAPNLGEYYRCFNKAVKTLENPDIQRMRKKDMLNCLSTAYFLNLDNVEYKPGNTMGEHGLPHLRVNDEAIAKGMNECIKSADPTFRAKKRSGSEEAYPTSGDGGCKKTRKC